MKTRTVIVCDDEPIIRLDLCEMLQESGFDVVAEAVDGYDAIRLCKEKKPDLVVMDVKMPFLDGFSASKVILEQNLAQTIVILTAYSDKAFVEKAKEVGVAGYIVKPVNQKTAVPAIEIAISYSERMQETQKMKEEAEAQLSNRKVIEKAKGLIMKHGRKSEEDAYSYIREISKSKQMSMKEVAEIILLKYNN